MSPSIAMPTMDMSSLHKRDDYSFQYFSDEPRINLSSTDPDLNPIFLFLLLSLMILVLLICIFVANKLLEIEREKEYDPKQNINIQTLGLIPSSDLKQNGLWSVKDSMEDPNKPKPEPVNDTKDDEYNRLKQQLESAPDNYLDRMSFYSTLKVPYEVESTFSGKQYSDSIYGQSKTAIKARDSVVTSITLDTAIEQSIHTMNSQETGDTLVKNLKRDTIESYSKKPIRKSVIPSARMSKFSVMTSDSLL